MKLSPVNNQNLSIKNQPSFGSLSSMGKRILNSNGLKKLSDKLECDRFSLPLTSLMVLFYGATVLPRYMNAVDKHDRREILIRDVTSITAILFFAKAMSRGFSKVFAQKTGFALNNTPLVQKGTGAVKRFFNGVKNYFTPGDSGINVLSSPELVQKYSNLRNYKNGISDFFKFIKDQGGDVGKILKYDETVKANAEKILARHAGGKKLAQASYDDICKAFKAAEGSEESDAIYKVFEKADNKYVSKAKTMNRLFDFLSIILLVPGLMIGIEKFNEHNTKKIIAREQAQKNAAIKKD